MVLRGLLQRRRGLRRVRMATSQFMAILLEVLIIIIIALINVLNFIWIDRKFMGRMFDFYGPYYVGYRIGGWLQNLADGIKLFVKEIIIPAKADKVGFLLAPVIFVGVVDPRSLATIPFSANFGVSTEQVRRHRSSRPRRPDRVRVLRHRARSRYWSPGGRRTTSTRSSAG